MITSLQLHFSDTWLDILHLRHTSFLSLIFNVSSTIHLSPTKCCFFFFFPPLLQAIYNLSLFLFFFFISKKNPKQPTYTSSSLNPYIILCPLSMMACFQCYYIFNLVLLQLLISLDMNLSVKLYKSLEMNLSAQASCNSQWDKTYIF